MSQSKLSQSGEVRIGHGLSEGEKQHVSSRRKTVLQCLNRHGIDCSQDSIPTIALLGSGGGERAMLGFLGSLVQLKKCDLLDSILYLSGVSGSTWCMASLYKEPDWSINLEDVRDKIITRLDGPLVSLGGAWAKLKKYYYQKNDNFSLTDFWAVMIGTKVLKEIDESTLSSHGENHSNDPYPIYTVIDKQCKKDKLHRDVWLEIGPHEAGCSLTGAFVNSNSFGSQYENGTLKTQQPEIDMLYLQGLCGSALADGDEIKKWLWEQIIRLLSFENYTPKGQKVLSTLVELNICVLNKEDPSNLIREMNELLKGKVDKQGRAIVINAEEIQHDAKNEILEQYTLTICENLEDWFEHSDRVEKMEDGTVIEVNRSLSLRTLGIIPKIIKVLGTWTWGTAYNFLHKMKVEDVDPSFLNEEKRYYEDAGLLMNSPYFPVLRKERHVDLIISLDFSAGDPMETVVRTSELCRDLEIPFPEVKNPGHISEPDDFYLFEGNNKAPTVIHIPLFNKVNCDGNIKRWEDIYKTSEMTYTRKMIMDLIEKAGENVINNKEKLLTQIRRVIEKKKATAQ